MEKYKVNCGRGQIFISQIDNGNVVITQGNNSESLLLTIDEMEKFAKALFKMNKQLKTEKQTSASSGIRPTVAKSSVTPNQMERTKRIYPNAYSPWSPQEESVLLLLHDEGKNISEMASALKRNEGAIRSRLKKLGVIPR